MRLKIPKPPQCPFCKRLIDKPTFLPIGFSDYQAGICECGAVYAVDETGFSRGAVFLEALLIACHGDWDLALNLIPEEDYQEIWIENYDPLTHTIPGEPYHEGRKIRGALCFIKLADDLEELKSKDRAKSLEKNFPPLWNEIKAKYKKRLNKREMESFLNNNIEELIFFVIGETLNLHLLQKYLYHPEEIIRKKTAIVLGKASALLAVVSPEKVLDFLKRLLYASADSAASPWGALEAVGEIIRETGTKFDFFVKNLFGFLTYPEYLISSLYALYRISEKNPSSIRKGPYLKLLNLFPKVTPIAQGLIILIFTHIKGKELISYKEHLHLESVDLFDYQQMDHTTLPLATLWENYIKSLKGAN